MSRAPETTSGVFRSQPVIGDDGLPVVWTEPILDQEEFDALQERIRSFDKGSAPRSEKGKKTSLLGIVFCVCGAPLYERTQRSTLKSGKSSVRDYCTCRTVGEMERCSQPASWRAEAVRAFVEEAVLEEPVIRSRWIEEPTGRTYRAEWGAQDTWEQKASVLCAAGVRVYFMGNHKRGQCRVFLPGHLRRRAEDAEGDVRGVAWPEEPETAARKFLVEWRESLGLDGLVWQPRRSASGSLLAGARAR